VADSQLKGATKNVSMGRMKNIQFGGFKNVWIGRNFGSYKLWTFDGLADTSSWAFLFTLTLSIVRSVFRVFTSWLCVKSSDFGCI
jgi:hypothetical protein